jgi:hypothetical protein
MKVLQNLHKLKEEEKNLQFHLRLLLLDKLLL